MKQNIRDNYRSSRKNLDEDYCIRSSASISNKCLDFILERKLYNVAVYYPMPHEMSTNLLINQLTLHGISMSLPCLRDGIATFANWSADAPLLNNGHFKEPLEDAPIMIPEMIVTPMLAFDRQCHRIGYGGGFYDRIFASNPTCFKLGVAYSKQEFLGNISAESHDVQLDLIFTEIEEIWKP